VAVPTYPWRIFDDDRAAFAWLGRDDAEAVRAQIAELAAPLAASPDVLRELRDFLARELRAPTLAGAARTVGASERSLQRALKAAGSSFRREVAQARVARAVELLEATDEKLESIARAVGFAALPQLSSMFRRLTGESPSALRRRRRPRG
jgi:AraC-like DNA-binding protein